MRVRKIIVVEVSSNANVSASILSMEVPGTGPQSLLSTASFFGESEDRPGRGVGGPLIWAVNHASDIATK